MGYTEKTLKSLVNPPESNKKYLRNECIWVRHTGTARVAHWPSEYAQCKSSISVMLWNCGSSSCGDRQRHRPLVNIGARRHSVFRTATTTEPVLRDAQKQHRT